MEHFLFLQIIGTIYLLFVLSPELAPIIGFLMLLVSTLVGKISGNWSLLVYLAAHVICDVNGLFLHEYNSTSL